MAEAGSSRSKVYRIICIAAAALILAGMLGWMIIEPHTLQIEQITLTAGDLPKDIGQLKILFITDLHVGYHYSQQRLSALVSRVNALKPDILLFGGDFATDQQSAVRLFQNFPDFHARYGIFAVLGESDLDGEDLIGLRRAMMTAGVTSLINETAYVRIGNEGITIAGIGDPGSSGGDVSAVAQQTRSDGYAIVLCHSPAVIEALLRTDGADGQRRWFDLGLFGHTHGGQIAFLDQLLGISDVNPRYLRGWVQENRIDMLVSNGVGTSRVPFRLGVPPQVHLITVKRN